MNLWLVNPHEPIPIEPFEDTRVFRMGSIAQWAVNRGHSVTWWSATFSHLRKGFYRTEDASVELHEELKIQLMHTSGYKTNLSPSRLVHYKTLATKFANLARRCDVPDVILSSYPPVELAYEAVLYGREHGIPVILDLRDMWPDALYRLAPSVLRPVARLALVPMTIKSQRALAMATAIMGITDEFVIWGLQKAGRDRTPVDRAFPFSYTVSVPSEAAIREAESFWDRHGVQPNDRPFTVCFFGSIGRLLGFETIIDAARALYEKGFNIRFILCGDGDRLEQYKEQASDLPNVIFPGWVDSAQIHVLMRRSDIGIDPLPDTIDFLSTINNKAVEYMSAGLPILVSPDRGVLHRLVQEHQIGLSYPPGESKALAESILNLAAHPEMRETMARNSRRLYKNMFSPQIVYNGVLDYLESFRRHLKSQ